MSNKCEECKYFTEFENPRSRQTVEEWMRDGMTFRDGNCSKRNRCMYLDDTCENFNGKSNRPPTDEELGKLLADVANKLLTESKSLPPEINKIINDNFFDLLA